MPELTTKDDVAAYVAAAAIDETTPRILRIAGDVVSARDLARIMPTIAETQRCSRTPRSLCLHSSLRGRARGRRRTTGVLCRIRGMGKPLQRWTAPRLVDWSVLGQS